MRLFTYTLTLLLFCCALSLHGQTTVGLHVLTGASSLTSATNALPADIGWHEKVAGSTFGLVVETSLLPKLSVRTGLQQTQRGMTLRNGTVHFLLGAIVPLEYEAQVRMSYLEVPLALKLDLLEFNRELSLYGWAGVTAGYAVTGSVKATSGKDPFSPLATTKLEMKESAYSRVHVGYGGGFGLAFHLGETMQFRLEAEYNRSLRDRPMISPESGKHGYQLLQFGGGVSFRL